jgi:hypothetical protein
LNVVVSFRNVLGNSAYESPGNATITTPAAATLYPCGLFSYGQNPSTVLNNFFSNGSNGGYPNGSTGLVFGLPPTYSPANQNGIGYALGFVYFFQSDCSNFLRPPGATAGTYTLSAPVAVNGTTINYTASATISASPPPPLGNESHPTFVTDGAGGGTFTISQPAGVIESLIVVFTLGFTEVATLKATGTSAILPDGTLAAGQYLAIVIGADYPLVDSGPPANTQSSPTLTGAGGTSDLTVSGTGAITE